jgi:hypothetical protein
VKAFADTKCSRSVVANTLQSVTSQAKLLREKIDLLEAGHNVGKADAVVDLEKLLDACQNLRDAVLSEDSAATWETKEQLHSLVERLDEVADKRRRYLDLAQLLAAGTVSHRRERTRQERMAQRDAAVTELMEISALTSPPPELPGPAADEWLNWACGLEDGANDDELLNLKTNFPRVDDFVRQLEFELWHDGPSSTPDRMRDAVSDPPPTSGTSSSPSADTSLDEPSSGRHISNGSALTESSASESQYTAVQVEDEPQELPTRALNYLERGKLCFFAAEEVESLARYLQQAKNKSRRARKVRALIAVSHWLLPREQNPLLHHGCGIRAQLAYEGPFDRMAISPEQALAAIESEDDLLLFTGGVDLLRWGITQCPDEPRDRIASIRRLTVDQLRAWFVELFKIALSEPQVQDIHRLTAGIPLLVGEMHRLIIPVPEAPPTWLGYGIWTEMKSRFQRRLPILGQELRNGSPEVRLANRELSLLKMVLIASDYSTPETIVSNLTDNWYQYHPPELPAMSSADEGSVELLLALGLLPARSEAGLGPIETVLPFAPDDPIRQMVSHP